LIFQYTGEILPVDTEKAAAVLEHPAAGPQGRSPMDTTRIPPSGDPFSVKPPGENAKCAGCRRQYPRKNLLEVTPERHDGIVFFDGDKLCRPCADGAGVAY
jgi:hypothetical protein